MDLRAFIDRLSAAGKLRRVEQLTDWKLDIGRIIREEHVPLLFENIKDYPGARVFSNGLVDEVCIAIALGLENRRPRAVIREAAKRARTAVKPVLVEQGPVLENIVDAAGIDFFKLPVPHWHPQDVGRYIGTWHLNITKDPETGSRNLGVYRMQVVGPREATVSTSSGSHLARQFVKAEAIGTTAGDGGRDRSQRGFDDRSLGSLSLRRGRIRTRRRTAKSGCPIGEVPIDQS